MKKIPVRLGAASYEALIANGLLRDSGRLIRERCAQVSNAIVITCPRIRKLWGKRFEASLKAAQIRFKVLTIPDGEKHKNLRTTEDLMKQMASAGADRSSLVIALGGGVVGDIAGFAAAIYMRGLPVVQVPSTLLAQVDASIGGKTGVNLPAGKNLVGAFHQPKVVLIDPEVLSTLPDREYRAGLFEIIKCGVIRDSNLFTEIERESRKLLDRDPILLLRAIEAAVSVKADIVSLDEREGDLRRILNFGHTVGHALEADSGYKRFLHGEAVGWGMIAAGKIGEEVGITPSSVARRIQDVVLDCGRLPKVNLTPSAAGRLIQSDKKTIHGTPHFVLATEIGKTTISDQVSPAAVRAGVSHIARLSARQGGR